MIQFDVQSIVNVGVDVSSPTGTTLTGGAANVKGAYAELTASSPVAAHAIILTIGILSASQDVLVDLAVGGAGSEVVRVENFSYSGVVSPTDVVSVLIPVAIASGSRISARVASTTASGTVRVSVRLLQSLGTDVTVVTTHGAATADSGGTGIDPGGTLNTKGAWVELVASTSIAYDWLILALGNQVNVGRTVCAWLVDIGTGAAASEVVLVPDISARCGATSGRVLQQYASTPVPRIAAGTRIAVRPSCSITDATDRLLDAVLYGVAGQDAASGGGMLVHPGMVGGLRG